VPAIVRLGRLFLSRTPHPSEAHAAADTVGNPVARMATRRRAEQGDRCATRRTLRVANARICVSTLSALISMHELEYSLTLSRPCQDPSGGSGFAAWARRSPIASYRLLDIHLHSFMM